MQPYNPLAALWLTIMTLCLASIANGQFRETYRGTDSANHITGMHFLNAQTGYVTFSKFIGFTQDGGKTFTRRTVNFSNTNYNGYSVGLTFGFASEGVVAFSTDSLLVYGHFSTEPSILFSSNGGQSWKLVSHRNLNLNASTFNEGITDIEFPGNGQVGYAVHHEQILKTVNRGQTWTAIFNTPNHFLRKLSCPSQNIIFASGGNKIYKSTDGGSSWTNTAPASANSAHYNSITFVSNNIGYCSEYTTSQVFKTINGGALWAKANDETIMPVRGGDLHAINDSTVFLATDLYEIQKTTDNGKTWELCKRENNYQYKYYGMNALFFLNDKTGWAGGTGEYLLTTTDGGAQTIPAANFVIDISTINTDNLVRLNNYSKPGYSYKWYKDGALISLNYNATYSHTAGVIRNEITLIVSNGIDSDTMVQYAQFSPPMTITSFTPEVGSANTQITIRGKDFFDISSVSFGGVPATFFMQRSGEIIAVVGPNGASGDIRITNSTTSASKSGFVFLNDPKIDLPVSINDNILCKEETVTLTILNSEHDVYYELKDASNKLYGSAKGTGGELTFTSMPISTSGAYSVWSKRSYLTTSLSKKFSQDIQITVEHPLSAFNADKVNAEPGETVSFGNYSQEVVSYSWTFYGGANISTSSAAQPSVTYNSAGQKSVTLISTTHNGCIDTLSKDAVFVYSKPVTDDVCYANNTEDEDDYYVRGRLNDMSAYTGDGYLICGNGGNPVIKSRYGANRKINASSVGHLARYTKDGVLKWINYVPNGQINSAVGDKDGNVYLTGTCRANDFYHFSNEDSMQLIPDHFENYSLYNFQSGFIMKIDASGKYVWHTLIVDPFAQVYGYQIRGGISNRIRLLGNQLLLTGTCSDKLVYYRNGIETQMVSESSSYPAFSLNNYILKIDTSGNYRWNSFIVNISTNQLNELTDVNIDNAGNVYVTGIHEDYAYITDFFNKKITLRGGGPGDEFGYILKFDSRGNLLWNVHTSENESTFNAFTFGPSGDIYITGSAPRFGNSEPFVLNNADGTTFASDFGGFFIAKINQDGKAIWTQGCRYSYYGGGLAIYSDGENIVCAGTAYNNGVSNSLFTFTSARGNINGVPLSESEFFLVKYDTSGGLVSINGSGPDVGGHLTPSRIFGDSKKNVLVGGTTDRWNGGDGTFSVFGSPIGYNAEDAAYAKLSPTLCSSTTVVHPRAGKDTAVCGGQPVTLGLENANGYNYSWSSYPSGFNATGPNVTVNPKITTTYYVSLFNSSGIVTNDTVVITVTSPLADAGRDKWVCEGSDVTIGAPGTGNSYSWTSFPAGFTSNVANPTVNVIADTKFFVEVWDSEGCKGMDTIVVTVSRPVVNAGSDTSVCTGVSIQLNASGTGDQFNWTSLPSGFTSNIADPVINALENTQYIVELTDSVGCKVTDTVQVNVLEVPSKPTIVKGADETLASSYAEGNQWYIDTEIIANANSGFYKPAVDGLYAVRVTQNGCTSEFSEGFDYKIPVTVDTTPVSDNVILLGPNPARQSIVINFDLEDAKQLNVEIYNSRGVLALVKKNISSGDVIGILSLSPGVYVLKFSDNKNKVHMTRRFYKL